MKQEQLNYSVAICALARDCEQSLRTNIPRIEALRNLFKQSAVVVVENDSKDGTKQVLAQWAEDSADVSIISRDFNSLTIPLPTASNPYPGTSLPRIEKMSTYRNMYMDWLDDQELSFDMVIMIDVDVISFSPEAIYQSVVRAPPDWGGLFANGYTDTRILNKPVYTMFHDMYAYTEFNPDSNNTLSYKKMFAWKKEMNSKLSKNAYLPVVSAFGGLAIYKYQAIAGLRYKAVPNQDKYMESLCEHVPFNNSILDRGYKGYVSRDLQVYYGKSEPIIVLRNLVPLPVFEALCLLIKFRKLKE